MISPTYDFGGNKILKKQKAKYLNTKYLAFFVW